jgi:phage protein D
MILPNSYGVSPSVEITFGGVPFRYESLGLAELSLAENMHDVLTLRVAGIPPKLVTEYIGTPVDFRLKLSGSFYQRFVGNIVNVEASSDTNSGLMNRSPFQDSTVTCMGASYDMRGPRDRLWEYASLDDVVRTFARRYEFSADVPATRYVYPTLVQTNESDWQFLVRYASTLGLSVTCHGTHIHVFDPYKAVGRNTSLHRISTISGDNFSTTQYPGQIFEFNGNFIDKRKSGTINVPVVSVVQDDGKYYDVSWRDLNRDGRRAQDRDVRNHQYVSSYEEAATVLLSSYKSAYDYEADVAVLSVPGAVPGGIVDLDNYESNFDGLWYVSSVKHRVVTGSAFTRLHIKRNIRSQLQKTTMETFREPPDSEYDSGTKSWKAVNQRVRVYS